MKRVSENPHKNNIATPDECYAYETGKQVQLNADRKIVGGFVDRVKDIIMQWSTPRNNVISDEWIAEIPTIIKEIESLKDKYLK